ncbi:hypothetical protein [Acidithiobacillus ferriphilus]|uniref:hypothetical protein n=1 Tax=Acidithiobacillus ferriphilus TaxID=1689834 RepID=UPI00242C2811|nr:hypothetical protein [Acidithiobacillus ferriphilus]
MSGVEYKTYGRIAPVGQENEETQQDNRAIMGKITKKMCFQKILGGNGRQS